MKWYFAAFKKFNDFKGRATRREYWMFQLVNFTIAFCLGIISIFAGLMDEQGNDPVTLIYSLIVMVPSLAISVRRLHDSSRSGWWLLISLIPLLGFFGILYFLAHPSEEEDNKYGPYIENKMEP